MSDLQFVVRGQVMDADSVRANATKPPPKPKREPEPKHGGFSILGWPPGHIQKAEQDHKEQYARYLSWDAERQHKHGLMRPWDELEWRAKHKQIQLANRATPGGADAMADLARKQGWTEIVVREVIKGKRP